MCKVLLDRTPGSRLTLLGSKDTVRSLNNSGGYGRMYMGGITYTIACT
jgi:hypothetical protein